MLGALAAHAILLSAALPAESFESYAVTRSGVAILAKWLLMPSLLAVLVAGLLAMAFNKAYHNAGWVWAKAGLGIVVFEGSLVAIQGPAVRAAERAQKALQGEVPMPPLDRLLDNELGAVWVMLAIGVANIVLAIWRPRFIRSKPRSAGT